MKVYACLWEGRDFTGHRAGKYGVEDVVKLRDGLAASNPDAHLHVLADGAHHMDLLAVPGITTHAMHGYGCGGWTPMLEAFAPEHWPHPGERHLLVGLDTVFLGDVSWLFRWDRSPVGLPLDPLFTKDACNAVTTFDQVGACIVWRAFMEERERNGLADYRLFGHPSEMMLLRALYKRHGWLPVEAEPERILSWRVHVRDGGRSLDGVDIVYFHGRETPGSLPASDPVRQAWASTPQPS